MGGARSRRVHVVLLAEDVDRNTVNSDWDGLNRTVVLLAEDVDRNFTMTMTGHKPQVVLLAEDVDRNVFAAGKADARNVVLLAEDVDRNFDLPSTHGRIMRRPPRGGRG